MSIHAIKYYNRELAGLGDKFLFQILSSIERIIEFPEAWHIFNKNTRRCLLHKFPYGIIYKIFDKEILVIAIANLHREPDYWMNRI